MKLVYVSGNYTNGDVAQNVKAAIDAGDRLLEQGYIPFIPHLTHLWAIVSPKPHSTWMMIDGAILGRADAIYMMKGWESSNGAVMELSLAVSMGKEIIYEEDLP